MKENLKIQTQNRLVTSSDLLTRYLEIIASEKALKKEKDQLRQAIVPLAKAQGGTLEVDEMCASVGVSTTERFNWKAAKEKITDHMRKKLEPFVSEQKSERLTVRKV